MGMLMGLLPQRVEQYANLSFSPSRSLAPMEA